MLAPNVVTAAAALQHMHDPKMGKKGTPHRCDGARHVNGFWAKPKQITHTSRGPINLIINEIVVVGVPPLELWRLLKALAMLQANLSRLPMHTHTHTYLGSLLGILESHLSNLKKNECKIN